MKKRTVFIVIFTLLPIIFCLGMFNDVMAQEEQQKPEKPLKVELITTQNPVEEGDVVTWYVTVSPTVSDTVNSVSFQSATDGQWEWQSPAPYWFDVLTTTQSFTITAVPHITGELTPILNVTAKIGQKPYSFFVNSEQSTTVNPANLFSIPYEKLWETSSTVFFVLLGASITWGTDLLRNHQGKQEQERKHKGQVNGILTNACINTQYAAENLSKVDTSILNKLFENEGLFEIIYDNGLTSSVKALWAASEAHNFGLDKPGGFERANILSQVTNNLSDELNILEE